MIIGHAAEPTVSRYSLSLPLRAIAFPTASNTIPRRVMLPLVSGCVEQFIARRLLLSSQDFSFSDMSPQETTRKPPGPTKKKKTLSASTSLIQSFFVLE
jgi:hypothetical protein